MNLLDRILGSTGQERTAALRDLGRRAEYYVPPELRGILGFAAEMTPSETLNRAAVAGGEMLAPGRTPMQRVGSAGRMLSETAGVAAPIAAGPRAGMTAAQSLQEGLLGFSMAADDAGRRFVERMNQPGPVPTMYSNPVDFNAFKKARAQEEFAGKVRSAVDDVSSGAHQARMDQSAFDLHKSGNLPLPVGTRVSPPSSYEMGNDLRISGYWVDPQDANVFGYKLQNDAGEEFREFVNNPRLGITSRSADRFGGGFKAFAGPNADDRLGFSAPSSSFAQTTAREPIPDSVQKEYDALFGSILPAPRNEAEAMAKQVLEMRAAGRAGDVTEEMMAATDPQYMFANTPLPMDEASRMARARELGRDTPAYRGTLSDEVTARPKQFVSENPDVTQSFAGHISFADEVGLPPELAQAEGGNIMPLLVDPRGNTSALSGYEMLLPGAAMRSRFARFDPAFAHLRNLSAGVGGLGLLSGLYSQEDTQ